MRSAHAEPRSNRRTTMAFVLPPLPYDFAALEPHIDARTMEIHHGKHHQTYVNNLNAAIEKAPELASKSLDDLMRNVAKHPEAIRTPIRTTRAGRKAWQRDKDRVWGFREVSRAIQRRGCWTIWIRLGVAPQHRWKALDH